MVPESGAISSWTGVVVVVVGTLSVSRRSEVSQACVNHDYFYQH
jgi:hypothetical protein